VIKRFESPNPPVLLVKALKALCEVEATTDNVQIYSTIKNMKYPENSKSNGSGSDKDASPKSEIKRSRSELSIVIMQQLAQPVHSGAVPLTNFSETQFDFKEVFKKEVLDILKSLNAHEVFLNWCINSIPIISPSYTLKYDGDLVLQSKSLHLPTTQSEAQSVKQCLRQIEIDINNILCVFQLPIMDVLNPQRISQLSQLSMTSLYCAIVTTVVYSLGLVSTNSATQTSSTKNTSSTTQPSASSSNVTKEFSSPAPNSDQDLMEEVSKNIVDTALKIYDIVNQTFKRSAQNNIHQNHLCMGAWMLLAGIQGAMTAASGSKNQQPQPTEEANKGKIPPIAQPRLNIFKIHQSFGVLNTSIAKRAIDLLEELLDELKIDCANGLDEKYTEDILIAQQHQPLTSELVNFNILKSYSSMERILCVLKGTTIQQLMTFLASIAYRKACSLKHLSEFGGEQLSYSDSTTYFNDTLSCSDSEDETDTEEDEGNSDDEEDSEGYLGSWLKEALSPEGNTTDKDKDQKTDEAQKTSNAQLVKDEPYEYLELASSIFNFLDTKLGDADNKFLNKYVKHGLNEHQMVLLANILKDLDSDVQMGINNNVQPSANTKDVPSNDAANASIQWMSSMMKFSSSIGKYMHNMISNAMLSESLQSLLLQNLGVSPWSTESNTWPLEVYSRTISIVVQILLLKPSQEKEAACLSVWHRLVNTLVEGVCGSNASQFDDYEDLNIEHAQMLLFLFHSLNLMQKKSILLLVAGGVIRCAEVCRNVTPEKPLRDNQLILLSRLLLFLEYLMKHLYSPPNILLEQVSWNLFSVFSTESEEKSAGLVNYKSKMLPFCRKDIEDKYRKLSTVHDGITIKPKFYSLTVLDPLKQNEFKLDGLAWNFILCSPDKVKYPMLIDSLISILNITDMSSGKVPHHSQFSIYYCFSLAWKLLLGLPPSTSHVENLISMEDKQVNLHTLLWSTRCLKPVTSSVHSHNLIVDCLIRQVRNSFKISQIKLCLSTSQFYFSTGNVHSSSRNNVE
jgi:E3 ubiquitin-protein ligase UBR4